MLKPERFTEHCAACGSAFSLDLKARLHDEQSAWQRIEIFETETFGTLMVLDGCIMLTDRDNFIYHEMMAHPVLFSHLDPKRVLIIGGGDCGTLKEVLKHPQIKTVYQVEIDERVTRVSEQYFPELCTANHDPRAHFVFQDALAWVKSAPPSALDVIVIDSTDPVGPAAGLVHEPFYRDCWRALAEGGLLVQQSESPLFHLESVIRPMRAALRQAGFTALETLHFPQCSYPSGWWSATVAAKNGAIVFAREDQAQQHLFPTRYYTPAVHHAALALPAFVRQALAC